MNRFETWSQPNLAKLAQDLSDQNAALMAEKAMLHHALRIEWVRNSHCAAAPAESNIQLELGQLAHKDA